MTVHYHDPRAAQHGEVSRVPFALAGGEGFHRGRHGIIAKNRAPRVQQHAFAVAAAPVEEEQRVIPDRARQRVAEHPLDERDQFSITLEDAIQY